MRKIPKMGQTVWRVELCGDVIAICYTEQDAKDFVTYYNEITSRPLMDYIIRSQIMTRMVAYGSELRPKQ